MSIWNRNISCCGIDIPAPLPRTARSRRPAQRSGQWLDLDWRAFRDKAAQALRSLLKEVPAFCAYTGRSPEDQSRQLHNVARRFPVRLGKAEKCGTFKAQGSCLLVIHFWLRTGGISVCHGGVDGDTQMRYAHGCPPLSMHGGERRWRPRSHQLRTQNCCFRNHVDGSTSVVSGLLVL